MDPSKAQIFILEVHPGAPGEPVACTSHTVNPAQGVPYEVLFYSEDETADISAQHAVFVDGRAVAVSPTLHSALTQLRPRTGEARYFWIEALCAASTDLGGARSSTGDEAVRAALQHSDHCAVWAGPLPGAVGAADGQAALDTVAWVAGVFYKPPYGLNDAGRRAAVHAALSALVRSAGWRKIWAFDRAALPGVATLYWGPCRLSWELVDRAAEILTREGSAFGGAPGDGVEALSGSLRGLALSS